ncbi:quinolinate synthase NadA [Porphyromonas circumdentaria]|uniref:Quinolinate synthase n=1 Tax=Porphyromonas circumdentaria TaxID=29524 RepID=A0A1T4N7F8_9PORP|nr:quinolinate synthase NadA [Porphyromonas circumdentaria]MBB6276065.1 quinolinate synthase [Porphyromonas circumdentaria]MDO4722453.1 quinolinate synthase NadA [Porphyromonas circumdentaria]SJZ75230.1 quinolinate synthetase [Porphyromonas circumdentaria]
MIPTTTKEDFSALYEEINALKKQHNAIVLAHYYARPEVQAAADFLGDSLALSQKAGTTDADIIVFCGVHFMAETASIISPQKRVLIPAQNAGCTLAESATAAGLATWKKYHPNGLIVSYVNTSAEVKAETDYCVTSSNALKVIESLPKDCPILFGPDRNLGAYIMQKTGRTMELWQGDCYVHRHITSELIQAFLDEYPEADVLIHPESVACNDEAILSHPRCFVGSTSGILEHPQKTDKKEFVIATEAEAIVELARRYPDRTFIPIAPEHRCEYMKLTTLEDLRDALKYMRYEVTVPEEIRSKALLPIQRMLSIH